MSSYILPSATAFPSLNFPTSFTNFNDSLTPTTVASSIVILFVSLILAEQAWWRARKGSLPGWKWQIVSNYYMQ